MPPKEEDIVVEIIPAISFSSREALEISIAETWGNTTEPKNAVIVGTKAELLALNLSHGDMVWGVVAEASDYQPKVDVPRVERGEQHRTKLNGIPI